MKKIILADDDSGSVDMVEKLMRHWKYTADNGYEVLICTDGKSALDTYNSAKPVEAALLDNRMPYITGLELARVFKSDNPGIKICMLSAYDIPKELGCIDDFISKPFDMSALRSILKKYLGLPGKRA